MVDNWRWTGTGWPGLFQDSVHSAAFQESKRNEHWSKGSPGAHVPASHAEISLRGEKYYLSYRHHRWKYHR